jgi:predicted ATPase
LALFRDAGDAVDSAVDIQRAVREREWPGIGELQVRIGLNSGPCKITDGDVLGRLPNLAARLQAAGHGGQILLSGTTAADCAGRLRSGEALINLGRYLMRGFDEPVVVHTVVADGLPADFPPLRAPSGGLDELPSDDTVLVGRDEAIGTVTRLVDAHRLVTLWGAAGVGKTRLALRVAATIRGLDDVRFVDLAPLDEPEGVAEALGSALRARPVSDETPLQTVVRALGSGGVLLVVDNCEQVLDGVRRAVRAILSKCRGVHILATSREPLGIVGESTMEVRTLPIPGDQGSRTVEDAARVPAVRLFVDRLAASDPSFVLTTENVPVVTRICRATDGLPLALELAAARAVVEGLDVAAESPQRTSSGPTGSVGIAGLSASFMRSVTLLDARQLDLFTRVAVFNGPFTRELARGVSPHPELVDHDLDRLVRTAMIQREDESGHYRLLVPARQFGWELLEPSARDDVGWAHARAMLARAELAEPMMRTAHEAAAVAALRSEFADHRAAVLWFLDHDAVDEAARHVHALFVFCLFQPRPEGHRWASLVADRLGPDQPLAAELTGAAAIGAWFAGDTAGAIETASRAIEIAETFGGSDWWARHALVDALGYAGDLGAVTPHFVAFIAASQASPDPFRQIYGLGLEAVSLGMFGKTEQGVRRAERAIAVARRLANPSCLHWGFYSLGRVLTGVDPSGACEAFEQAMRASREVGCRFSLGHSLQEWVALKRRLGERNLAVAGALDLFDLLAVSGNRAQLSEALREAGSLLAEAGRNEQAALVMLARQGMPAMPLGMEDSDADSGRLAELEARLASQWGRLRVRAQALTEPDLIALCREELGGLSNQVAETPSDV